ncbi:MAG: dephospho-CoA kinase [Clostridia bacterium]|nr:dephospho-CoA kinase [Clostridia bacterium]
MRKMFILGVTGPSGAGKGTACKILSTMGFYHIDTDSIVPLIYPKALPQLIEAFGPQVAKNGTVDKKALANAAFSSSDATNTLNSIVHPLIMGEVSRRIREAEKEGFQRVTVDGAALHEANAEKICDKILCILAPKEDRLIRVIDRDGISRQSATVRFNAQKDDNYYKANSDAIILNCTVEQLQRDLIALIKEWESLWNL